MQFRENTPVYTADGQEVGTIDRVIIDPATKEVSHVVVRQGWLFTEDKVVPTEMIDQATADQVRLRGDAEHLDELPPFEERYYVPYDATTSGTAASTPYVAPGYARPYYPYPPIGAAWPGYFGAYGSYPMGYYAAGPYPGKPYAVETERNIPQGTIALKEGAKVVDSHGDQVGSVARVFTNDETHQVTHLLIAEGWLFPDKRLVPTYWIRDVTDEEVALKVDADFLKGLPEYREQQ